MTSGMMVVACLVDIYHDRNNGFGLSSRHLS